jgi:hypothetical protein
MVEKAEDGTGWSMIQVPRINVAGYTVGPVWFTASPDKNFDQWMSQRMTKQSTALSAAQLALLPHNGRLSQRDRLLRAPTPLIVRWKTLRARCNYFS